MIEDFLLLHKKAKAVQGEIPHTHNYVGKNLSCGDELKFFFNIQNGVIQDVSFISNGCVVSTVFAYLFSEKLRGRSVSELQNLDENKYFQFVGQSVGPNRLKCALLPFVTFKRALNLNL